MKTITSAQNSYIKELLKLQEKSRERKKKGLFLVEGLREISLVQKGNFNINTILFEPSIFTDNDFLNQVSSNTTLIEINKEVYQKLAYRASTEGIIAVVTSKDHSLDSIKLTKENPFETFEKKYSEF